MVQTESVLTGANSTSAGFFLLRVHSPKISTSWKKIAQIYLPDLPLFASLDQDILIGKILGYFKFTLFQKQI